MKKKPRGKPEPIPDDFEDELVLSVDIQRDGDYFTGRAYHSAGDGRKLFLDGTGTCYDSVGQALAGIGHEVDQAMVLATWLQLALAAEANS